MGLSDSPTNSPHDSESRTLLLSPKPNGILHNGSSSGRGGREGVRWERASMRRGIGTGPNLQEEVLKTLQLLISRQELDDESEEIASEWREVAQVIDRLLFWVFLLGTGTATLTLLVIIPIIHSPDPNDFDVDKFGMPSTDS